MQELDSTSAAGMDKAIPQSLRKGIDSFITVHPGKIVLSLLVLLVLVLCAIEWKIGLPHSTIYSTDLFILLDAGWRLAQGQRPHVDFYSAFGPVDYLLAAWGLKTANYFVKGVVYYTAAAGLILGVWATLLARTRLRAWASFLFVGVITLFWLSNVPMGEPYYLPSYAMQYNRLGYILTIFILLELFTSSDTLSRFAFLRWGGISTGIALGLLLFLKISFFFVALLVVAGWYIVWRRDRHYGFNIVAAFALTSAVFLAYLHWDVSGMLNDFHIAALARRKRFEVVAPFRQVIRNISAVLALFATGFLAQFAIIGSFERSVRLRYHAASVALVTLVAELVLSLSNTQRYGFPLCTFGILVLADGIAKRYQEAPSEAKPMLAPLSLGVILVATISLLPWAEQTVSGWTTIWAHRNHVSDDVVRIDSPQLSALVLDDYRDWTANYLGANNGAAYVRQINEGLALIRSHSNSSERLNCLCFSNPFSYALGRQPARGGSPFFDDGTNYTEAASPTPERILGNAELIIYNRGIAAGAGAQLGAGPLLRLLSRQLAEHYVSAGESEHWVLLRRNTH